MPTPLAVTLLRAPMSRMDVLEEHELVHLTKNSKLVEKYNNNIDRESAYELLIKKIEIAEKKELKTKVSKQRDAENRSSGRSSRGGNSETQRSIIRVLTSPTVIRSVLGILGKMMR